MNIVIMGATSHIAKGLIFRFLLKGEDHLYLFSRSTERVQKFLTEIGQLGNSTYSIHENYKEFSSFSYDVIINCVGVETRNKYNCDYTKYFTVTGEFDNLAVNYLQIINPEALYISFSSGAVYGRGFSSPVDKDSVNCLPVNNIKPEDYYGIVRLNAEAKHRAFKKLNIVDLRIFSYFSRFINVSDGYFITDVIESILRNKVLITDSNNIVRDYLHPEDLFTVIQKCIRKNKINNAFDIQSSKPVYKQEILNYFLSEYGLEYKTINRSEKASATGSKINYYSIFKNVSLIDFIPQYSSIDTLIHESKFLLHSPASMKEIQWQ